MDDLTRRILLFLLQYVALRLGPEGEQAQELYGELSQTLDSQRDDSQQRA